jgi:Fur family peroxide stress response transcriptional regulator
VKEGIKMSNMVKEITEKLNQNGIKPSYARIRIMEYLLINKNHPSVDQIYSELVQEIPTLSKTTVYNTLNTLLEVNLVRLITIEDHETRYDANVKDHGHFRCEKCEKIFDFWANLNQLKTEGLEDFAIRERNAYYIGVCPKCQGDGYC